MTSRVTVPEPSFGVRVIHDGLVQRGGAERVALVLARHFGNALWVPIYSPGSTFADFRSVDVKTSPLNRLWTPILGRAWSGILTAIAVLATRQRGTCVNVISSSGWAHWVRCDGPKIVYCHNPARWLYQTDDYFGSVGGALRRLLSLALTPLRWLDQRRARSADFYLANSRAVAERILRVYGRSAEIVHPPVVLAPAGAVDFEAKVQSRTLLTVSRARGYKRVNAIVSAMDAFPTFELLIVGEYSGWRPPNVRVLGRVEDSVLADLYGRARLLIVAGAEDFGLTPIEAHAYGTPVVALEAGGYLDTVQPRLNGVFFATPARGAIVAAIETALAFNWDYARIQNSTRRFSIDRYIRSIDKAVAMAKNMSVGK